MTPPPIEALGGGEGGEAVGERQVGPEGGDSESETVGRRHVAGGGGGRTLDEHAIGRGIGSPLFNDFLLTRSVWMH
jgi:hypothetical protein